MLLSVCPAQADETGSPAEALFSRHIVPLFSRLGCNAGNCHGAVQGKNGFRLGLFGADPTGDHQRLLREYGGRRINLAEPEASLLLLKASGRTPHEGGRLLEAGSSGYEMLLGWLRRGAPLDAVERSQVQELVVEPAQRTAAVGSVYALRVRAKFADGSIEDVTRLSTFDCRDRDVASVDRSGQVAVAAVGSARLVVRYRGQPVGAQLLSPGRSQGEFPRVKEHNFVDKHVLTRLRQLNIPPAALCDDVTFLRRLRLDVTGELPAPAEIRAFVQDDDPAKRAKKIDAMLQEPGHAAVWATKFADFLRLQATRSGDVKALSNADARRFYEWLRARLRENTPYDQVAERILLATSGEGRGMDEILGELEGLAREDAVAAPDLKTYAQRRTLDLYWQRPGATGVSGAVQAAHAFLGLRLQCAQCHRHPTDVWQQNDLLSFANFFMRVQHSSDRQLHLDPEKLATVAAQEKALAAQVKQLNARAADKSLAKDEKARIQAEKETLEQQRKVLGQVKGRGSVALLPTKNVKPATVTSPLGVASSSQFRLLGAVSPQTVPPDEDPRLRVVAWLRRADKPFFARAMVNRVWAHYFGRGIVDPPDDLSPLNPPTHPELLTELSDGFIQSGFDLRWLHRSILASRTYQQSSAADGDASPAAAANYARFALRRLTAETLVDAINHATASQETYPPESYLPAGAKAMEVPALGRFGLKSASVDYAFQIFGRSSRSTVSLCDCDSSTAPAVVQVLYLAAYDDVLKKIGSPQGRAAQLADVADVDERIEEAFLWVLCRRPTDAERRRFRDHFQKSATPRKGAEDLLWVRTRRRRDTAMTSGAAGRWRRGGSSKRACRASS